MKLKDTFKKIGSFGLLEALTIAGLMTVVDETKLPQDYFLEQGRIATRNTDFDELREYFNEFPVKIRTPYNWNLYLESVEELNNERTTGDVIVPVYTAKFKEKVNKNRNSDFHSPYID